MKLRTLFNKVKAHNDIRDWGHDDDFAYIGFGIQGDYNSSKGSITLKGLKRLLLTDQRQYCKDMINAVTNPDLNLQKIPNKTNEWFAETEYCENGKLYDITVEFGVYF